MKTFLALLVASLLVATAAWAQTPAFEVASVKPNPSVTENSGENTAGGRFTATNDTLKQLVQLTAHQGAGYSSSSSSAGSMNATKATMAMLASRLERQLGRTVADHTGLTGEYDYRLTWVPDQAADSTGPSIFTALEEQLGLRLDSAKGPVEIIVIESAEKPSAN